MPKGMFGFSGPANFADALAIIGATLKDADPGSSGGNIAAAQSMISGRQMQQMQLAGMKRMMGLFGGGAPGPLARSSEIPGPQVAAPELPQGLGAVDDATGAVSAAVNGLAPAPAPAPQAAPDYVAMARATPAPKVPRIADPETMQTLAMGAMLGVPGAKELVDIIDKAKPHVVTGPDGTAYDDTDRGMVGHRFRNPANVNGWMVDQNDPAIIGQYFGKLPEGVVPNGRGGVSNITGLVPAMEGQAEATERGKTMGSIIQAPSADGSTAPMLGSQFFGGRGRAGGGLQPDGGDGAPGGGFGRTPSIAEKEYLTKHGQTIGDREAAQPKDYAGLKDQARTTDLVIDTINQILGERQDSKSGNFVHAPGTGLIGTFSVGGLRANVPGTNARNLEAKLNTIRANVGFDKLQQMRATSPTGGALGAVSDTENKLLQSVLGSLDPSQSPKAFADSLRAVRDQLARTRTQRQQLYEATHGAQPAAGGAAPSRAAIEAELRRRGLKPR